MRSQAYGKAESDKRYEAVVKHYSKGALHMAYFDELNQAHSFLLARWAKVRVDRRLIQIDCGGAIYDQRQRRKRVLVLGADYLTNEKHTK